MARRWPRSPRRSSPRPTTGSSAHSSPNRGDAHVIYEIANELYAHSWQLDQVRHIHNYQNTKPNQHPVWLSAGGRIDDGTVREFSRKEAVDNDAEVWGPSGGQGFGQGMFRTTMPLQSYAAKPAIVDTDHGISPDFVTDLPWKAICRGYHYNLYEAPREGAEWWGTFPYPTMSGAKEELVRKNVGQLARYANERFAKLGNMTPSDATAVCSTKFCLRDPGVEYLCYAPSSASFRVAELVGGRTYEFEWFNPETGTVTSSGNQFVANGSSRQFSPPYAGHAVLHLRRIA